MLQWQITDSFPVAAQNALHSARAIEATPASPTPAGAAVLSTISTTTARGGVLHRKCEGLRYKQEVDYPLILAKSLRPHGLQNCRNPVVWKRVFGPGLK